MNILKGTTTYLVGSIQYENGEAWRKYITEELKKIGVICFNPYDKPFVYLTQEDENTRKSFAELMEEGRFDELSSLMREIRVFDLNLVDRCDFVIAYINPQVVSAGSFEECYWANRIKKPIFLVVEGGKKKTPLWLMGTIPHRYIFDDFDSLLKYINDIDSGKIEIDHSRFRLLKPEFRPTPV